ncbi:aminotransferase class III-fold pyridoxal phosphate-dependent enzyme [Paeniglutamicibacter cryotolerans]|uniref:4-aminobutyrate aminotransferase-like enzyme/Ser/Thr protein kinase RdoA (MazF antagonist) n=1 Tax=Paeniglutamicibacter cryotolerans TaxID=670079 RepID=A0A839QJG5_9MICC|nr:aminotransferase class III-fold pyridoxal phosphate-dependent enzyme [Paeniglutamicibacter cryotolerans]MBB2995743.1 4-aminobutyrate aminotransferase-like enzyme/Ser/Thr protein kinase RdoA (MazF antagonist) [Paeniglutamicibacter cryotolerans]
MDTTTDLRSITLAEAEVLIRAALPAYGIEAATAELELLKHRENFVYRLIVPGARDVVVRLHRPGLRSDAQIGVEMDFLAAAAQRGISVPEVIAATDGRLFICAVDPVGRGCQIDLQEWIDGSAQMGSIDEGLAGTSALEPEAFLELGVALARLHELAVELGPVAGASRGAWDAEGLTGEAPLWGDPLLLPGLDADGRILLGEALAKAGAELCAYGTGADRFGAIHADATPENVLVSDTGLRVIDFDDFGPGFFLFDLVTALFWYQPHPRYPEYEAALFSGYRSVRRLGVEHLELWPALRLARGASYLGWAAARDGQDDAGFITENVLPLVLRLAANYPKGPTVESSSTKELLARRYASIGKHSPLFYSEPLSLASAQGVWITATDGTRYLDGYNNVPHVGHANPTVVEAARAQGLTLNLHSRYLNEPMVAYAEKLLATFDAPLDKVFFTNSGSESNELALRIARQHTGDRGVLISDFSYHGNTTSLAEITTGLTAREEFADYARTIHIPDLEHAGGLDEEALTAAALAQVDEAIASLADAGYGLSCVLLDPLFSTEGLNKVPRGYVTGLADRVHAAGGLVISDEVQSGFGRTGHSMWGFGLFGINPDLVTLGKPMGNGHPMGAVVTTSALLDEFGEHNMFFNTFGGNPVSAAVGMAVLQVMEEQDLVENSRLLGLRVRDALRPVAAASMIAGPVKGTGLFFGVEIINADGTPWAAGAKAVIEHMKANMVLVSRIGPNDNVLKMRPPMVINAGQVDLLVAAFAAALDAVEATVPGG